MGVSTDAILAYGYDLGEAYDIEREDEDDSKGEILERRLLERLVGFTESWTPDTNFWERQKEAEEKLGLQVIYHCSGDYPMYFLAIRGSEIRANRGYPVKINYLDINDNHKYWNARLKEGMEALGIEPKDEPGYHLFSMWG